MSQSTKLGLPYLVSAQAQKHVTVNESLLRLDALVQLTARSHSVAAQPVAPNDGDLYLLPTGKTGATWASMAAGAIAYYRDGVWEELTPKPGWRCYVEDAGALLVRGASEWENIWSGEERRLIFTPGGDGVVSIYRIDTARVQNPRSANISSISGDMITLTAPEAGLFFGAIMTGCSYVRIWNTSKSPAQPAWVKASPAANQLQVVDATALSGWVNGETIQIGDPTSVTPNRFIALDISPMMQTVLGRTFRQSGVLCKVGAEGIGVQNIISLSEAGVAGAQQPARSLADGKLFAQQLTCPCSIASPVSNSNLVLVQETATGAACAISVVSVVGVWT